MASADILRAAHSPLPWSVQEDCKTSIWSGGHYVAEAYDGGEDTAAFIVRACNERDQMLEALKDISRAIEAKRQIWGRDLSADMRDRMLCCNDKHFRLAEEKVRAAIAAAEAEAGR